MEKEIPVFCYMCEFFWECYPPNEDEEFHEEADPAYHGPDRWGWMKDFWG